MDAGVDPDGFTDTRAFRVDAVVHQPHPGIAGEAEIGFAGDIGHGVEHDLAEVAEGGGFLLGDAVLGQCGEDFAEDVDDVGAGDEVSGEGGGKFRA